MRTTETFNFINLILKDIALVKQFKQTIRLNITSKQVCKRFNFKFYLRKRWNKLYLYTRVLNKGFGNRTLLKEFLQDLKTLLPMLQIVTTKGHYKGIIIDVDNEIVLRRYLEIVALLSNTKAFTKIKRTDSSNIYKSNNLTKIPMKLLLLNSLLNNLKSLDIKQTLNEVKYETN